MSSFSTDRPRLVAAGHAGFSLLEVLVAFVILSLVATALFRLFSGALNNVGAAEEYSRAVLVSESALEQAAAGPLKEGTQSGEGDEGRVHWTAEIVPFDPPPPNPESDNAGVTTVLPVRLYRITVTSTFAAPNGGERKIALSTMRLGARETQSQ